MQTDRDRLIELLDDLGVIVNVPDKVDEDGCGTYSIEGGEYIADYLLANGVIVPPCKVGDKVYYPSGSFDRIFEKTVDEITKVILTNEIGCYIHFASTYMPFENIGKTVFLTKEEAEQKLKEREG